MAEHIVTFGDRPKIVLPHTRRRLAIMIAMATGWLPWGVEWEPCLPLCKTAGGSKDRRGRSEYVLCCGHVLRKIEAQKFVDASLLKEGPPDRFGRPTLVIGDEGERWIGNFF